MKKFWVSLLSVLVLFGGFILVSCGSKNVSIELNETYTEICLNDDVGKIATITAEVKGISDGTVTVSSSNTAVATATSSFGRGVNVISIEGLSEGEAEIYVTSNYNSGVRRTISVVVYSNVKEMAQKEVDSADGKSDLYVIRNDSEEEDRQLDLSGCVDSFIKFTPEKARKNISWSLPLDFELDAEITNNILIVGKNYFEKTITVIATDEISGVKTDIVLGVVDKLDENTISMRYNHGGAGERPLPDMVESGDVLVEAPISLVPNISDDPGYKANVLITVPGKEGVDITPRIFANGIETDLLVAERLGYNSETGTYIYELRAGNINVNRTFDVYFDMGYEKYNYKVTSQHFTVRCYERINRIDVLSVDGDNEVDATTIDQDIYTNYSNANGAFFKVRLLPTTVVNSSRMYKLTLDYTRALLGMLDSDVGGVMEEGDVIDENTLQIYYRDGSGLVRLNMTGSDLVYSAVSDINSEELYIKANDTKVKAYIKNVGMTLTSVDNANTSASVNLNLYKAAGALDFGEGDYNVNLATHESRTITKTFTLSGQTSVDGLSIVTTGNGFAVSGIRQISADLLASTVTFEVDFSVRNIGYTGKGTYKINHRNGFSSADYEIDLYLPLTDAQVDYDRTNDSVLDKKEDGVMYQVVGNGLMVVPGSSASVSEMYVRNGTNANLVTRNNRSNGQEAEAKISYRYLDFDKEAMSEETFLALINNPNEIYNSAREDSNFIQVIPATKVMQCNAVGYTYLVVIFEGKDATGNNVTFVRIVLVENYVTPSEMVASPQGVSVYANNSVSEVSETERVVRISLGNTPVTYTDLIENFAFISGLEKGNSQDMDAGKATVSAENRTAVWDNGYYMLSEIDIRPTYITFKITGLTTRGVQVIPDQLTVRYTGKDKKMQSAVVDVRVVNADRIEEVEILNIIPEQDSEGNRIYQMYFDIYERNPEILVFRTGPDNARNKSLTYLVTDKNGDVSGFVNVSDGNNGTLVRLRSQIGMLGYIYAMPTDAIFQNTINYYVKSVDVQGNTTYVAGVPIGYNQLGRDYTGSDFDGSWYSYLKENAYFLNNRGEAISFNDILVRVEVVVADGSSEELAYHIFTEQDVNDIRLAPSKWYRLMNNVKLQSWVSIDEFTGGLKGDNTNVTINLNGQPFADINRGTVKEINFNGQVVGGGFVANQNYGLIDTVKIDVNIATESGDNGVQSVYATPSLVNASGKEYAGAIVGQNLGVVSNVSVFGASVINGNFVGGIIGKMDTAGARLTNAKFEIYTFAKATYNENPHNVLSGQTVGGLVGELAGGTINNAYAYDYALQTDGTSNLSGTTVGGFAGLVTGDATITNSFTVVNANAFINTNDSSVSVTWRNAYLSRYNAQGSYLSFAYDSNGSGSQSLDTITGLTLDTEVWAIKGSEGINKDFPYLKNFYQNLPISSVADFHVEEKLTTTNGLYKAISVKKDAVNEKAILFHYAVSAFDQQTMNSSELRDLTELNTISLTSLLGITEQQANSLVILSANTGVVDISGNNLIVKRQGEVELNLTSKQDYTKVKTISVKVIYALSDIRADRVAIGGSVEIEQGSPEPLQRGKNLTVVYSFKNPSLHLGNRGNRYNLVTNNTNFVSVMKEGNNILADNVTASDVTFTYTTNGLRADEFDIETTVTLNNLINVTLDTETVSAINKVFNKAFKLRLFNGAIALGLTGGGEEISITPSTMGEVNVTLITNDEADDITPVVSIKTANGYEALTTKKVADNMWTVSYLGVPRLTITHEAWTNEPNSDDELWTKRTDFYFSVHESYRGQISENQQYKVQLQSNLQVESEELELLVSRQDFTKIDISNYQVTQIVYNKIEIDSQVYSTIYSVNESVATAVLAPGSTSILAVNINPDYAYYQYMTLEYTVESDDNILSPISIDYMTRRASGSDFYVARDGSVVTTIGNGISVVPANRNVNNLYFKLWAKNIIKSDMVVTLTAKFYDGIKKDPIKSVNFPLTISYLTEPKILIDGSDTAILAKGQTATIQVVVPYDQDVDIDSLTVDNVKSGITIYSDWVKGGSESSGIKTYTTQLSASIRAELADDASGMFVISVSVRRQINGYEEIKLATARVHLVDFKVDGDNISLAGKTDDTFVAYVGIAQPLVFDIPLLPSEYRYDESDPTSQAAMDNILQERKKFTDNGYYANADTRYYINYTNPGTAAARAVTVDRLLYFESGGQWHSVYNGVNSYNTIGGRVEWFYDEVRNVMSVRGSEISGSEINMRLVTNVYIAGREFPYEYRFKIVVRAYSDEDVPLLVYNAEQFLNMAKGDTQNYILMDDIYLDNYTPISTSAISSLDGNGFTVHINSFNTDINSGVLNLALFDTVSENTTIKNVRVNLYSGGQITVDVAKFTTINIAGFALTNAGTITNCEVVSYRGNGNEILGDTGLNIKYIRGANTTPISITGSNETSTVAGFVNTNSGSITNSRVGGESIYTIGAEVSVNNNGEQVIMGYNRDQYALEKFNIIAQGNVAGFVNTNSGAIASSFVKRVGFVNDSDNSSFYTAGFVGINSGKVLTSFIEGVKENHQTDAQCLQGSSINSKLGIIAGFIYQNGDTGIVQDSFSNILIANKAGDETVFLASGFVYSNEGTLENCFSSSQVANLRFSQMNFSGVDSKGNLQTTTGKYVNCYYYVSAAGGGVSDPVEADYGTGATKLVNIDDPKYFYGFSFTENTRKVEGIWAFVDNRLTLVEPNNIAFSNRYRLADREDKEKYSLPYSNVYSSNSNVPISLSYGSEINPIIIRSAEEFVNVTGRSTSSFISSYFTETTVRGNYRLVNDIDFSELLSDEQTSADMPSTLKTFTGTLYGNGFTMENLSITAANSPLAFGLFASIENGVLINVDLTVSQVVNTGATMVGTLAGYIKNSNIININVTHKENSEIQGLNFVGGVAGMVYGDSKLKNITVTDANIIANSIPHNGVAGVEGSEATMDNRRNPVATLNAKTAFNLRTFIERNVGSVNVADVSAAVKEMIADRIRNFSYAGGLFGYVDTFKDAEVSDEAYAYNESMELDDYSIIKVRMLNSVNVRGQVAGGIAGFTGYNTHVKDAGVELADNQTSATSHIMAVRFYAGGLVGQAYGSFAQVYTQYSEALQRNIEDSLKAYYISGNGERGSTNIFAVTNETEDYSQKYIGGLIGYAGSGCLTIGYSKLNVTSMTADYAGGLVGGVNSGESNSYYVSDGKEKNVITNLFIQEMYATGDVRAKKAAGGIIGQINKGSRVKLAAVNSANFISLNKYNSSGDNYTSEDLAGVAGIADLTFDKINVYSIAGDFSFMTDQTNSQEIVEALGFVQLFAKTADTSASEADISVGTVKRYTTTLGSDIKLNIYPGYEIVSKETAPIIVNASETFTISNISTVENSEQGHQAVYGSFIGTMLWPTDNWYHNSDSFYPNIKFSVAQLAFVYLDQYNALEVLRSMKNSNLSIKVRGKLSENVEQYGDVDLREILNREEFWGGSNLGVDGYQGTLAGFSGNDSMNVVTSTGVRPGIILNTPLFSSVKEGFNVTNLTVRYEDAEDATKKGPLFDADSQVKFSGAFINSTVKTSQVNRFSNLTLQFGESIFLYGEEAGLIAPRIEGMTVSGIKIEFYGDNGNTAAVTVNQVNNFGLITGVYIQNNINPIKADGISLYDGRGGGGNFILANLQAGSDDAGSNIGAYFGKVDKDGTGEVSLQEVGDLDITVGSLRHWEIRGGITSNHNWEPVNNIAQEIFVSGSTNKLNLGGYIGNIGNVDKITISGGTGDSTLANVKLGANANISSCLNAGIMIGYLNKPGEVNVAQSGESAQATIISGKISSNEAAQISGTVNLGGLIGLSTSQVSISNVSVALQVDGDQEKGALNNKDITDEYLTTNYTQNVDGSYIFIPFKTNGATVNVGGYIGQSKNSVSISYSSTNYGTINEKQEVISVRGSAVNVGSMIGLLEKAIPAGVSNTTEVLNITGQYKSNALIQVEGLENESKDKNDNKNVGGFVGKILLSGQTNSNRYSINIGDTDTARPSAYMGQIYVADGGYRVGGILGGVYGMSDIEGGQVTVQNTVFGGAIKIYGLSGDGKLLSTPWDGEFVVGGTIGELSNGENGKSVTLQVNNNNNFGDLFVMYREANKKLKDITYGGLIGIGYINAINANGIQENCILNTYNNPRPNATDSAHAVFGNSVNAAILSANNLYNHSVCLLTDDYAIDAGYTSKYSDTESITGGGYSVPNKTGYQYNTNTELAKLMSENVSNIYDVTQNVEGSKLNPEEFTSTGVVKGIKPVFNGMYYYAVKGNILLASKNIIANDIKNVAIIGNGFTITKDAARDSGNDFGTGLITKLSGQAFVSGVNVMIDVYEDITQAYDSESKPIYTDIGGLIQEMAGGTIYAVGLQGKLSIGGDGHYNVGGMVGKMSSGYIMNSFADVEIIYRAAGITKDTSGTEVSSKTSAVVNTTSTDAIIDRTYAVGSVESYIDTYLDAFSSGEATVRNSYSAANLFWKDYTSADTTSTGRFSVFKAASATSSYYDKNAMNTIELKPNGVTEKKTADLWAAGTILGDNWLNDYRYNYGYPTQSVGYLKPSSFKNRVETGIPDADYGIETHKYSRLTNEEAYIADGRKADTVGNYNDFYYTIPNVGVWYQRLNTFTGTKTAVETHAKITLRNDIYFDYIASNETINLTGDVQLELDGRTHRLYNFTGQALFENINKGSDTSANKVINVDILKANITNGSGILASAIGNITVSNVTLSGDLNYADGTALCVGGLAGDAIRAKINSVTNNTYINVNKNSVNQLGGIIGKAQNDVLLRRCVNNGPIYYSSAPSGNAFVGGLVGEVTGTDQTGTTSKLEYCYNTGSVAAGYNVDTTGGTQISAGGIAGCGKVNIDYCYNSGLIKAGNKKYDKTSYAGGIAGKTSGTITNSINEGSVEALAKNVEYEFKIIKHPTQNPCRRALIQLINPAEKNVYADGIGFNRDNSYLSQLGNNNVNTNLDIEHNGVAFEKGDVVNKEDLNNQELFNTAALFEQAYQNADGAYKLNIEKSIHDEETIRGSESLTNGFGAEYTFWWKTEYKTYYAKDDCVVVSRDNYNFPTGYYVKLIFSAGITVKNYDGPGDNSINYYVSRAASGDTLTYQQLVKGKYLDHLGNEEIELSDTENNKKLEIMKQTEAIEGSQDNESIEGKNYLLTNIAASDLMSNMNSAYAYTAQYTPNDTIINLGNYKKYKFGFIDNNSEKKVVSIGATGWNVTNNNWNGRPTFDLLLYTKEAITDAEKTDFWKNVTITFSYTIDYKKPLDLSNVKYSNYENGNAIEINISDTVESNAANKELSEILGGGHAVGFKAKRQNSADSSTFTAYKVAAGLGTDVYLTYNANKKCLTYYKDLWIEKDSLNNPGEFTLCNTQTFNTDSFAGKEIDVNYGLLLKLEFTTSEIKMTKDGAEYKQNDNIHRGTNSSGNYVHSTSKNVSANINQNVTLGDSGKVVVNKNSQYIIANNISTINTISGYSITPKTEFEDRFLFLSNVTVNNKIKLLNPEKEASIMLGTETILTYTKVTPEEGAEEGAEEPVEPTYVWTLVNNYVEMVDGLEEGAARYKFHVSFDEETMMLKFELDQAEVSEEERDAVVAFINGLVESGNYLTIEELNAEPGEPPVEGEEPQPVEEIMQIETVTFDETRQTEKIYTFTSEFTIDIDGTTGMTLSLAGNQVAKWNGSWINIASDITVDGVTGTITYVDGKFKIVFTECKEDVKVSIESILDKWALTYDSISFSPSITELSSGDVVSFKYSDNEIATFNGSWTKVNDLIIEGNKAVYSNGVWSYNDIEYTPENDLAVQIVAEMNKITNAYKTMKIGFAFPNENVDKAIIYGATEESVVATYSGSRLTAVGDFSEDVSVSTSGNTIYYTIDCENKSGAQIDAIIAEINKSIYYRQFNILNKNVYGNGNEYLLINIEPSDPEVDSKDVLNVDIYYKYDSVRLKNSAFTIEDSGEADGNKQFVIKVNTESTAWQNKSALGITVYYGTENITGLDVTYKVKKVNATITNPNSFGYLNLECIDLKGATTKIGAELAAGASADFFDLVPEGNSSTFTIGFTLYRTYIETALTTGGYDLLKGKDMTENADRYWKFKTDYKITYGIHKVHEQEGGDPVIEGSPSQTYTYNRNGDIVAYTKPVMAKQTKDVELGNGSTQRQTIDFEVTYRYQKNGDEGLWQYEKSLPEMVEVKVSADETQKLPKTETVTLMTYVNGKYAAYGKTETSEILTEDFADITIIEDFYEEDDEGKLKPVHQEVRFSIGDFQLDNLTEATRTKYVNYVSVDENGNTIYVTDEDGNRVQDDDGNDMPIAGSGIVRYRWRKADNRESWSYFTTNSEVKLLNYDGNYWSIEGQTTRYNSLESLFSAQPNNEISLEYIDEYEETDEEGNPYKVRNKVSVKFTAKDFSPPKAIPISQVAVVEDDANYTLRTYIVGDTQEYLSARINVDYVSDPISKTLSKVVLPNKNVVSADLDYLYERVEPPKKNELKLEDQNKNELTFTNWDSIYSTYVNDGKTTGRVSLDYRINGIEKLYIRHIIDNKQTYTFTDSTIPQLRPVGIAASTRSKTKVQNISARSSSIISGIIFTRNINLGEVPQYMSFAGHMAGNDYTLSYLAINNSTLFDVIEAKDENDIAFIKELNIVGQIQSTKQIGNTDVQGAAIITLENKGKLINLNTFGNIRNVISDKEDGISVRGASGAVLVNNKDIINIVNYSSINGLDATSGDVITDIVGLVYSSNGYMKTLKDTTKVKIDASISGLGNKGLLVAGNGKNGLRSPNSAGGSGKDGSKGGSVHIFNKLNNDEHDDVNNPANSVISNVGFFNRGYVVSGKGGAAASGFDGTNGETKKCVGDIGDTIEGIRGNPGEPAGKEGSGGNVYTIGEQDANENVKKQGSGNEARGGNGGLSGFVLPRSEKDHNRIDSFNNSQGLKGMGNAMLQYTRKFWKLATAWPWGTIVFAAGLAAAGGAGYGLGYAKGAVLINTIMQPTTYYGTRDFTCGNHGDVGESMGDNEVSISYIDLEDDLEIIENILKAIKPSVGMHPTTQFMHNCRPGELLQYIMKEGNMLNAACPQVDC